jgi:hypothetical protein
MVNNPNPYELTIKDIRVVWNSKSGGQNNSPLNLQSLTVTGIYFQTVYDWSGDITITPTSLILPANGPSTMIFMFDSNYETSNGSESITIHFSTFGCEDVAVRGYLQSP